jgi:hypothetical protein
MDTPDTPLGISALNVSSITNFKAYLTARAFIGEGVVRHDFTWVDREYPVVPYVSMQVDRQLQPVKTFFPQKPMETSLLSASAVGWLPGPNSDFKPLHGFTEGNSSYLRWSPELEVKVRFNSVTPATTKQLEAAKDSPIKTVPGLEYNLDLVMGSGEGKGLFPYITNTVKVISGKPMKIVRGHAADFVYQTKYHKKMEFKNFREGRRLLIDGEVFRIIRITADTVSLVSDPVYGGSGKIIDKQLKR